MRTIKQVYETYSTPPWLQMHQLRVAAVAKIVAEMQQQPCDDTLVITTCLLHDIGAIVKFDFGEGGLLGDLYALDEREHWAALQEEYIERYGAIEHDATHTILEELGVPRVIDIFERLGFSHLEQIVHHGPLEAQIVQYADMRVAPHGAVSLDGRFDDTLVRYARVANVSPWYPQLDTYRVQAHRLERVLFQDYAAFPEDITDAVLEPVVQTLWEYEIA